ncbi:MAG: hypothetical protein HYU36_19000 [Planctomycetes bacterium]|nr:hypothetical protein [Planctomycetota bacterium]
MSHVAVCIESERQLARQGNSRKDRGPITLAVRSALILSLAVSGCTTVRTSPDYSRARPAFESFVIVPAQVVAEEVMPDRTVAEQALMAERISESVSLELEANLRAAGRTVILASPEAGSTAIPELQKSFARAAEQILKDVYTSENSPHFRYSVGESAKRAGERYPSQAIVMALMNARVKSPDHWRQNFVDSATQMALQGSGTVFSRSDADLHLAVIEAATGKIVWFNTLSARTFLKDGTTPAAVRQMVRETFKPFF